MNKIKTGLAIAALGAVTSIGIMGDNGDTEAKGQEESQQTIEVNNAYQKVQDKQGEQYFDISSYYEDQLIVGNILPIKYDFAKSDNWSTEEEEEEDKGKDKDKDEDKKEKKSNNSEADAEEEEAQKQKQKEKEEQEAKEAEEQEKREQEEKDIEEAEEKEREAQKEQEEVEQAEKEESEKQEKEDKEPKEEEETKAPNKEQEEEEETDDSPSGETINVSATAYTKDCYQCSGTTSTGVELSGDENIIATDPAVIPTGSTVHVEGMGEYEAADVGGAINQKRIDILMPTEESANNFGRQDLEVTIID